MGQTDGGLIGTGAKYGAKHASLSEWPLSWLDGISMGKTDGPIDDHKRQTQNGVVDQGEPGYFSLDYDLNMKEQTRTRTNSPLTPFQALLHLLPHICSIFSSRTSFYRNLRVRTNSVCQPNLPFIEICQSFELNLFIHGDKVSISNLRMTKHQTPNDDLGCENNLMSAARSRLHLADLNRTTMMVDLSVIVVPVYRRRDILGKLTIFTWGCPCTCAPEPRWKGAKGWRSARRRSSFHVNISNDKLNEV